MNPKPPATRQGKRERKTDHLLGWIATYWYVLAALVFAAGGLVATWGVHLADRDQHLTPIQTEYINQIARLDQRQQNNIEVHRTMTGEVQALRQSNVDLKDELRQLREEIRELRRVIDGLQRTAGPR